MSKKMFIMNLSKNFTLLVLCLAVGFVTCNCAPTQTLDTDAIVAQILGIDVSSLTKEPQQLRQVEEDLQEEVVVVPLDDGELEEEQEIGEIEDDLDDEEWEIILDPDWDNEEEQEDDGQIYEDDEDDDGDWENDFDYIDNKETGSAK